MEYWIHMSDGGSTEDRYIEADSIEDARDAAAEECRAWASDGDWGDDGARIDVRWTMYDDADVEVDEGAVSVEIEPDHAKLILQAAGEAQRTSCGDSPDDHDWTGEVARGGGGTIMKYTSHCRHCGLQRHEVHRGPQRNPGDHDTVSYRWLEAEEIASHVADGSMEDAE